MGRELSPAERSQRARAAHVANELAALGGMTGVQLVDRFEELFGRPAGRRSREYLRKRIAWEIQARLEGGLSERALQRIDELAALAPEHWRRALDPNGPARPSSTRSPVPASEPRDVRLPSVGTVITRLHAGVEHQVTILADGFDYQGERYRSLSKIARLITGTAWNGFHFFFGRMNGTRPKAGERSS